MPTGRHAANKRPDRTPWADQGGAKRREREAATQTSPKVSLGMPTQPAAPGDPGAVARFHHHWPWQGARACVFGHAGGASEARELDPPRADPVPDGGGAGSTGASGSDGQWLAFADVVIIDEISMLSASALRNPASPSRPARPARRARATDRRRPPTRRRTARRRRHGVDECFSYDGSHSEPDGDGLHAMTDFTLQGGRTLDELHIARYVLKYVLKNGEYTARRPPSARPAGG